MSPRRRRQLPAEEAEASPDLDLLSEEARELLSSWKPGDQQLFTELLQDAQSELQQELLRRTLAAGHSAAELHAFADEIRAMSDDELFEACTPGEEATAAAYSVQARLLAEADPLYGFELKGHRLTPQRTDEAEPVVDWAQGTRSQGRPPPALMVPPPAPVVGPRPRGFEAESAGRTGARRDLHDLGGSAIESRPYAATAEGRIAEDLLNEAVRSLGVTYQEQAVDGPQLKLEKALESAHSALMRGVPIPVILGPQPGQHRRYALILQVSTSGKTRAFQLHDPFSQETVWVNEGDLFARTELPFSNKTHRRITAIALPNPQRKLA